MAVSEQVFCAFTDLFSEKITFKQICISVFLTSAPKAGVIVVAFAVRAAAVSVAEGLKPVGVPQTKPMP